MCEVVPLRLRHICTINSRASVMILQSRWKKRDVTRSLCDEHSSGTTVRQNNTIDARG